MRTVRARRAPQKKGRGRRKRKGEKTRTVRARRAPQKKREGETKKRNDARTARARRAKPKSGEAFKGKRDARREPAERGAERARRPASVEHAGERAQREPDRRPRARGLRRGARRRRGRRRVPLHTAATHDDRDSLSLREPAIRGPAAATHDDRDCARSGCTKRSSWRGAAVYDRAPTMAARRATAAHDRGVVWFRTDRRPRRVSRTTSPTCGSAASSPAERNDWLRL